MFDKLYYLVSSIDANDQWELGSKTFEDAVDEAINMIDWYMIESNKSFVGVNSKDSMDTIELREESYEDAQYELLEQLGYFISGK